MQFNGTFIGANRFIALSHLLIFNSNVSHQYLRSDYCYHIVLLLLLRKQPKNINIELYVTGALVAGSWVHTLQTNSLWCSFVWAEEADARNWCTHLMSTMLSTLFVAVCVCAMVAAQLQHTIAMWPDACAAKLTSWKLDRWCARDGRVVAYAIW